MPPPLGVSRPATPLGRGSHERGVPALRPRRLRAAQRVVPYQDHEGGAISDGARPHVPLSEEGAPRGIHEVPLFVRQNLAIRDPVFARPIHVAQRGTRRGLPPNIGRTFGRAEPRGSRRTASVSYAAVSSSSHKQCSWYTERPWGPVDVCPFRDDPPDDFRLANAMTSLAARYFTVS